MSYDLIERFLRNNLDDDDYKEYSAALDELCTPKRPWVGLTEEEVRECYAHVDGVTVSEAVILMSVVRITQAKLKGKNT
jgi:hypothetical protein